MGCVLPGPESLGNGLRDLKCSLERSMNTQEGYLHYYFALIPPLDLPTFLVLVSNPSRFSPSTSFFRKPPLTSYTLLHFLSPCQPFWSHCPLLSDDFSLHTWSCLCCSYHLISRQWTLGGPCLRISKLLHFWRVFILLLFTSSFVNKVDHYFIQRYNISEVNWWGTTPKW